MRKQYKNPFIKSPQQLELEDAVKVFKIWFHMLEYGDPVDDAFYAFHMMTVVLEKAIHHPAEKAILNEAIKVFKEATEFNAWRKSYTKPVNSAMDVILKRFARLPKEVIQKALLAALETT
mgnify:FL=1